MAFLCNIANASLLYWQSPGYLLVNNQNLSGLAFDSYLSTVSACCSDANSIQYDYHFFPDQTSMLSHSASSAISLPIVFLNPSPSSFPRNFVPIADLDTLVLMASPVKTTTSNILTTLFELWPLFLELLGLAALFAYVIWCLETYLMREQSSFSTVFAHGVFESFWCMFITAMSVGYGDMVAKSVIGKALSLVWVLLSWAILATIAGTYNSLYSFVGTSAVIMPSITSNSIGVLQNGVESSAVEMKAGSPVTGSSLSALMQSLSAGNISAILINPNAFEAQVNDAGVFWSQVNLRCELLSGYSVTIGFLFMDAYRNALPAATFDCLQHEGFKARVRNKQALNALILNVSQGCSHDRVADYRSQLFTAQEIIFSIATACSALALIFVTQIVLVLCRRVAASLKAKSQATNGAAVSSLDKQSCSTLNSELAL